MDCGDFCQVVQKPSKASMEPQSPVAYGLSPTLSSASDSPLSHPENTPTGIARQFAPSPDVIALSSLCHHFTDKMRITPFDPDSVSDDEILESLYQNLLEAIVSLQIEGNLTDFWSFDACKTPLSVHCSDHVPDSCPGAPMKLTRISRNIDPRLRRKLF